MNWKKWESWKDRNLIAVILFIIAYTLTIPFRNYSFLNSIIDTTQGVPLFAHLLVLVVGLTTLIILLEIISMIIRYSLKK